MLEDFGGRTLVSQIAGIEFARAAEAVRALALVHAEFWNSPKLDALTWMPNAIDPINLAAGAEYRRPGVSFWSSSPDTLPEGSVALGQQVGSSFEADGEGIRVGVGDGRSRRLPCRQSDVGRFGHRPRTRGILDWQISSLGAGIGDIAYLVTQSMTVENRRAHERDLVGIWYEALCAALGGPPAGYTTLEDAWDGSRSSTGFLTGYAVIAGGGMDPSNERGVQLVTEMATRSFTAALDLDAASVMPA